MLAGDGAFVDLNEELLLFDLLAAEGAFVDLNEISELELNDEDDFADVTLVFVDLFEELETVDFPDLLATDEACVDVDSKLDVALGILVDLADLLTIEGAFVGVYEVLAFVDFPD